MLLLSSNKPLAPLGRPCHLQERRKWCLTITCLSKGLISHSSMPTGLGLGSVMFVMFCSYGLAVWYGGKMILEKGHSRGEVFSVIVAILSGSLSLGKASPCLTAFAAG